MPSLGDRRRYTNRPQRYGPVLLIVLVLGIGAYGWINDVLAARSMAALLAVGVAVLLGTSLVLRRRLQLARVQRDRALARARATERQMSDLLRNQDRRMEQRVARRMQEMQNEIADLHAKEQLLIIQAHQDGLTGLANRVMLIDRFRFAVERAKRSGKSFALVMIDLNDFKAINDNYGHAAGDLVLVTVARRLVGAVRACDTVARLGGDEFVLIIESFEDPQELVHVGRKLIGTLSDPITLDTGGLVRVGASVGLALYPDHGADINGLLCVADLAMYECKSTGQMSLQ